MQGNGTEKTTPATSTGVCGIGIELTEIYYE
jgi:hypothetical protein